jgi:hypothetical protein
MSLDGPLTSLRRVPTDRRDQAPKAPMSSLSSTRFGAPCFATPFSIARPPCSVVVTYLGRSRLQQRPERAEQRQEHAVHPGLRSERRDRADTRAARPDPPCPSRQRE